MVELKINGKRVTVPDGTTILDAARTADIPFRHCATIRNSLPMEVADSALWRSRGRPDL